ncbi:MAG: 16S rRNA (uracil(1498)-N(3))-methyltransferase [Gammaproteobacteria bacterium]|nr:16S rRNA (uracil(1498)-N(3))-methyltransferase [Gammaproteobacteria bacterium]
MRLIRVFVESALAQGAHVATGGAAAAHMARVLRLAAGDPVTLFNGDGSDYSARIVTIRSSRVEIEVLERTLARPESPLALTLVQGIARAERMDLIVQKATELGAAAIQPVVTSRSVVRLDAKTTERKLAHWRGIVIAACEQCGRARLPGVATPLPLPEWLARPAPPGARRLQLAVDAMESLGSAAAGASVIELLIGPEGGLDDDERKSAATAGYRGCSIGPRVLRTETAALAALAVLQASAGDLG